MHPSVRTLLVALNSKRNCACDLEGRSGRCKPTPCAAVDLVVGGGVCVHGWESVPCAQGCGRQYMAYKERKNGGLQGGLQYCNERYTQELGKLSTTVVHGCVGPAVGKAVPGKALILKLLRPPAENAVQQLSQQQRISSEEARNRLVLHMDTENPRIQRKYDDDAKKYEDHVNEFAEACDNFSKDGTEDGQPARKHALGYRTGAEHEMLARNSALSAVKKIQELDAAMPITHVTVMQLASIRLDAKVKYEQDFTKFFL
ncbi:hypothetical protein DUNSADRAFT_7733 [Dunaliella salina]|uniref:Uncharacterized protein n=1 Tax=Dunaliella salina TaxID=3046 RepID=A0ABQ7GKW1_DUNSA|nr:hypothetical protein DUNSADRAFT_7733 [Dunaliella salina]|eukprot:KAF5835244.1 hypothetical protein DUNSADRAFT_7733 [Dunaliella salina]